MIHSKEGVELAFSVLRGHIKEIESGGAYKELEELTERYGEAWRRSQALETEITELRKKLAAAEQENNNLETDNLHIQDLRERANKKLAEEVRLRGLAEQALFTERAMVNELESERDELRREVNEINDTFHGDINELTRQNRMYNKALAESQAELARVKSQWVEKVSTVGEVMSTVVSGDDILIDVDLFHRLRRDARELKGLKSQAEAGQWAVTSSKLSGESEARSIAQLLNCHPDTANDYKAVPLHAPAEDGPWVVRDNNDGTFIESYYDGNDEWNWTIHLKRAKRMTLIEAEKAAELSQDYAPVRLADVEREGE